MKADQSRESNAQTPQTFPIKLLELTCGARSPEGKSHQNDDVPHQNLMTCANVTRFELFFGRDRSRTWNQMSLLDPFLVPFLREIALVSSLSSSETGSKMVRTDTDTHMIFWDLPYTTRTSGAPHGGPNGMQVIEFGALAEDLTWILSHFCAR